MNDQAQWYDTELRLQEQLEVQRRLAGLQAFETEPKTGLFRRLLTWLGATGQSPVKKSTHAAATDDESEGGPRCSGTKRAA